MNTPDTEVIEQIAKNLYGIDVSVEEGNLKLPYKSYLIIMKYKSCGARVDIDPMIIDSPGCEVYSEFAPFLEATAKAVKGINNTHG